MAKVWRAPQVVLVALLSGLTPSLLAEGSHGEESWRPEQIQSTEPSLNWSDAKTTDSFSLDKYGRRPPVRPGQLTFFLACERPDQLDCIESFGLIDSNGAYTPGEFVRATTEIFTLDGVGPVAWHSTFWEVPQFEVGGAPVTIRLDGNMGSEKAAPGLAGMQMGLELVPKERPVASPDDLYGCIPGPRQDDACVGAVVIPEDVKMRLVFRTSWISPAIVRARMKEAGLSLESLGNGALRWSLEGKAMLGQSFTLNPVGANGKDRPAWVATSFDFFVWDPRIFTELNSECYANGPMLYSFNGMTGGQPNWNPRSGTLDINIGSAHYWPDGKTIWRGYYQTSIPETTARCLWGVDPRLTQALTLEVYDDSGKSKAATTAINFRNGNVNIYGYDFTYSTTKLSVRVMVKKGERCFTQSAQVKNLQCAKVAKKNGKKQLVWVSNKKKS